MKKSVFLILIIANNNIFAECPKPSIAVIVNNKSSYTLRLETKEKGTTKLHHVGTVKAFIEKKQYCVNHNYLLKVTTYHQDKRVAISATDLWNDVVINAFNGVFDVQYKRFRRKNNLSFLSKHTNDEENTSGFSRKRLRLSFWNLLQKVGLC